MRNKKFGSLGRKFLRATSMTLVLAMLIGSTVSAKTLTLKDVFDANYYSQTYEDLSKTFGTDVEKLYNHYVVFGQKEERTFTMLIDLKKYREAYPDLNAAFGDDWNAYLNHYMVFGIHEGRQSFGAFDAIAYADRYPDLKAALGYDVLALYRHYLVYGIKEGRDCTGEGINYHSSHDDYDDYDEDDSYEDDDNNSSEEGGNGGNISAGESTETVRTSGRLTNPETGAPVANATVRFTRTSGLYEELAGETVSDGNAGAPTVSDGNAGNPTVAPDGSWYEITTDANGDYVISNLPSGVYSVEASAPGYMTLSLGTVAVGSSTGVYSMPTFELLSADGTGANDVTGQAKDATTGRPIAGVTLKIRSGWNNYEGEVVSNVTTDAEGRYSIRLERGYYTIEFVNAGYVSTFVNVFSSNATRSFNGTLNPSSSTVEDTQLRVVLTWGETPRDLDSHLVGPSSDNSYYHVYFGQKVAYDGNNDVLASLDVDDVSSYGPETVTMFTVESDKAYYYSVHDFTNSSNANSTQMSASGAIVKVYQGSTLLKEYNVPTGQAGFVWNVFKIVNGQLIDVNEYNSEYNTMYGDYRN